MATCKDCLCFDLCSYNALKQAQYFGKDKEVYITIKNNVPCKFFKDKSKIVELPCKVGDTVFFISKRRTKCSVFNEFYEESSCNGCVFPCDSKLIHEIRSFRYVELFAILKDMCYEKFGKTVFLTKEEAEKALKERENK